MEGGFTFVLSQMLPNEERRTRVMSFLANPDTEKPIQIWYGTGANGKTILARLVTRVVPDLHEIGDVTTIDAAIAKVPRGTRGIIVTNVLDQYDINSDMVVHFDQNLDGLGWIDINAKGVNDEVRAVIATYKK